MPTKIFSYDRVRVNTDSLLWNVPLLAVDWLYPGYAFLNPIEGNKSDVLISTAQMAAAKLGKAGNVSNLCTFFFSIELDVVLGHFYSPLSVSTVLSLYNGHTLCSFPRFLLLDHRTKHFDDKAPRHQSSAPFTRTDSWYWCCPYESPWSSPGVLSWTLCQDTAALPWQQPWSGCVLLPEPLYFNKGKADLCFCSVLSTGVGFLKW